MENTQIEILALFLCSQDMIFSVAHHKTQQTKPHKMPFAAPLVSDVPACGYASAASRAACAGPCCHSALSHGNQGSQHCRVAAKPCPPCGLLWFGRCPFLSLKPLTCVLAAKPDARSHRHCRRRDKILRSCFCSPVVPLPTSTPAPQVTI